MNSLLFDFRTLNFLTSYVYNKQYLGSNQLSISDGPTLLYGMNSLICLPASFFSSLPVHEQGLLFPRSVIQFGQHGLDFVIMLLISEKKRIQNFPYWYFGCAGSRGIGCGRVDKQNPMSLGERSSLLQACTSTSEKVHTSA